MKGNSNAKIKCPFCGHKRQGKAIRVSRTAGYKDGFIKGFQAKQGISKEKYENDLIDFHNFIFNHKNQYLRMGEYLEQFKSLSESERKLEIVMEGICCTGVNDVNVCSLCADFTYQPKTTKKIIDGKEYDILTVKYK